MTKTNGTERAFAFQKAKREWQDEFYKDTPSRGLESRQVARARQRAELKKGAGQRHPDAPLRPIKLSLKDNKLNRGSLSSQRTNVRQAMRRS